jgi:hypothetical protein
VVQVRYTKEDVTFHSENWSGDGHTAVNVKVRFPYSWEPLMEQAAKDAMRTRNWS